MLKEELKLIVTFHTTTGAMHMEKACKESGAPGRLIAIPDQLTAGCGFAWSAEVEDRALIEKTIDEAGVETDQIVEIVI